ncbi:MAG: enoyl-CoA hydratase-related protein, partial [Pseudodonghicola sp.]
SWTLPRLVGEAKAKELMFLPGKLSAAQVKDLGLVNFLVKAEDYAAELAKLTGRLAAGPRNAQRFIKANINASHAEGLAATLDREATSHVSLMSDADFHEGMRAFLAKRAPVFR